ncbi:MAG: CoA-binding protein [Candidatus Nitrosocaldus sp.]|nr:CoA-binding protein [Candidatus Nitrosocaldus sp.]MDW8000451.1 CoA-binding protein [Candidatus Nitrosocaldus sp.]
MERDGYSDDEIRKVLSLKNIAVVGISRDPSKDAHIVPRYLMENGYNIIPVNPFADEILGKRPYKSLRDVQGVVDVVDVFRPSDQVPPIVREAIEKKAKVLWLQLGIYNKEAIEEARRHGMMVVYNRCMMQEHRRLYVWKR